MNARQTLIAGALALLILSPGANAPAQQVTLCPDTGRNLAGRWEWAQKEASTRGYKEGYWTGYSIEKMMEQNSFIGSFHSDARKNSPSLMEQVYKRKVLNTEFPQAELGEVQGVEGNVNFDSDKAHRLKVLKDIGILIHHDRSRETDQVTISNMSLHMNLQGDPLLWLGAAQDKESIALLGTLYGKATGSETRKHFITAVAFHQETQASFPFLRDVLSGSDDNDVRKETAFWLGQTDTEEALKLLVKTATDDRSGDVRENAVFGISQMDLGAALDALISLARNGKDREVRKKAIFWLGQKASDKAVATLERVANDDEDTKIQKEAVFALTQLPESEGVEPLIKIAKTHTNPSVRKEAIFWLSQSEDDRAFEALIEIVKK